MEKIHGKTKKRNNSYLDEYKSPKIIKKMKFRNNNNNQYFSIFNNNISNEIIINRFNNTYNCSNNLKKKMYEKNDYFQPNNSILSFKNNIHILNNCKKLKNICMNQMCNINPKSSFLKIIKTINNENIGIKDNIFINKDRNYYDKFIINKEI